MDLRASLGLGIVYGLGVLALVPAGQVAACGNSRSACASTEPADEAEAGARATLEATHALEPYWARVKSVVGGEPSRELTDAYDTAVDKLAQVFRATEGRSLKEIQKAVEPVVRDFQRTVDQNLSPDQKEKLRQRTR